MNAIEKYVELLAMEGYRPVVGEEDEIRFKVEGAKFRVFVDREDPDFVAIALGFRVDGDREFAVLTALANAMNEKWKVVKTTVHPDRDAVKFQFEAFAPGTLGSELLQRAIAVLRLASDEFFEELRREAPEAKA